MSSPELASIVPEPEELDAVLRESTAVVIGAVEGIESTDRIMHLGPEGSASWFTNLRFRVDRYLIGGGPEVIYVRHMDDLTIGWDRSVEIAPRPGERVVLFLTPAKADQAPDPLYWPTLGHWTRLAVAPNGGLTYLDGMLPKYLDSPVLSALEAEINAVARPLPATSATPSSSGNSQEPEPPQGDETAVPTETPGAESAE